MPMNSASDLPRISCLMVTADRAHLCKRAILCYKRQTYPNKELVVVDDGKQDLGSVLADLPADEVVYVKLEKRPENVLGRLRNLSIDAARGTFLAQWDDDDWYHATRLEEQAAVLMQGYDACCLSGTLMHLDTPEFFDHPYIGYLKRGIPGTIMHRRDEAITYPEMRQAEDTEYLQKWIAKRYTMLPKSKVHLFIRCFHGGNTWEERHFMTRMRNTLPDLLAYGWYRHIRRDLFAHPRFRIDPVASEAFRQYVHDSRSLDLFQSRPALHGARVQIPDPA